MPEPPWSLETGIDAAVKRWRSRSSVDACFTAERELPAEPGSRCSLPDDLDPAISAALRARNIVELYDHQATAIAHVRAGRHLVLATPTASGKSLCFHLPVLETLARDKEATALYLYPTKALSRDQEASLRSLIDDAGLGIGAVVYDGDTPGDARRAARQSARVVMTNPDMLHSGILPQHASWARTLQKLRYVIVDELHTYRGVFGSHVANVLARLLRVARFHGASPTVVCATATIGNPREHAARLIGCKRDEVALIDRSTAPRGARKLLVYNPPVVNAELGIRASYLKSTVRLVADLLRARVRTLVFGQSRNSVEIMLKYLRDRFANEPAIRDAIVAYRGGYLPGTRRRVESGLREGQLLCVVATSALELGIDVGDLDAVVCAGYPGSLAEIWQRFGRAGRRGESSLALMVASSAPLDQFVAQRPELMFDGSIEQARIDPDNTEILVQHLKCAAFELPFRHGESFADMPKDDTAAALGFLEGHGVVHASRGRYFWASDAFPANHVSLRSVGWDNFVIIDQDRELALAELDWHSTPTMLHEQAIYQHDGVQYQVERLDYDNHKAYVRKVEPDYFTTAMRHRKVTVIEREAESDYSCAPAGSNGTDAEAPPARLGWGEVNVVEKVVGYKKIKFHTHENAGYGDVRLPDIQKHTTSFWLTVERPVVEAMGRAAAVEGLRGVANALETVTSLALMCDPRDIGRSVGDAAPQPHALAEAGSSEAVRSNRPEDDDATFCVTAYLFDNVPGGVGLAERMYERATELLERAAELLGECDCPLGCPACVGATALAAAPPVPAGDGGTSLQAASVALPAITEGWTGDRKSAALELSRRLGLRRTPQADRAPSRVVAQR